MIKQNESIQWYPGHMAKANRQIREKIKYIDVIIEVLDARVPIASRNPDIRKYTEHKKHIILLNKADLADTRENEAWVEKLKAQGADEVLLNNAFDSRNKKQLVKTIRMLYENKNKNIKCLILGIPNVGKSTVINALVGKRKAQIGNKPGVTKGQQWLNTPDQLLLLDTPGILWPKFDNKQTGIHLACIGAIKETIFEKENIAGDLIRFLCRYYPQSIENRYGIVVGEKMPYTVFEEIAETRKLLIKGGEYDYKRTAEVLLGDYKNGRLGRITLERCS